MSDISFAVLDNTKPPTNKGRPRNPLPPGLSDDSILKIRRRAQKMARTNNASFPVVFFAKVLSGLAEQGFVRLSAREALTLASQAAHMPDALAVVLGCFVGKHPPRNADFRLMTEFIRAGCLGGVNGLIALHHHIRDRQRKAMAKMLKHRPPNLSRPKLLPLSERLARRAEAEARETEAEIIEANQALAKLYPIRHRSCLKHHLEFIEVCMALRDAGFELVRRHREHVLEIAAELSV